MVHHNCCPLCESEQLSLLFYCKDHFISGEAFQIVRCTNCGFEFTQDSPEESEIGKYYESADYISHSNTSKGLSNKLYRLARKFMLLRKRGLIKNITGRDEGNLLDIGSGTGHFADSMKNAGWRVKGIEINEKARQFSSEQFGLEVIDPRYISSLETGSFDCITLWHVMEHFHDPDKYASEIRRLLKPGGTCIIALPNSSSSDAVHFGMYWAAYDVPRHLWHFNSSTFGRFAEKNGFNIRTIKSLPLDAFYISILSERYKGSRMPLVTGLIKGLWFWFLLLFSKNKASSLIYILKKK